MSGKGTCTIALEHGGRTALQYLCATPIRRRFPPNTHGFVYYHTDPALPPIAGEIRFRITSSPDPASFKIGTDLLKPTSHIWATPLLNIATLRTDSFRKQLLAEGLVTPELLLKCKNMAAEAERYHTPKITLYSLDQPFVLDVGRYLFGCTVAGKEKIGRFEVRGIFTGDRVPDKHRPYKGRILVRFEHSPLPEHAGRDNVMVLRVLKVIIPVEGEHHYFQKPAEGSLIQTLRSPRLIFLRASRDGQPHPLRLLLPSQGHDS